MWICVTYCASVVLANKGKFCDLFLIWVWLLRCSAVILRVQPDTWDCKKFSGSADTCNHLWISQGGALQLHSSSAGLLITYDEGVSRGKAQHGQYRWRTHMGFMWVPCGYFERQTYGPHEGNCCILQYAPLVAAHVWPMRGTHMGPLWGKGNFAIWDAWGKPKMPDINRTLMHHKEVNILIIAAVRSSG